MTFNFLNQGQTDDTATRFTPIDTFIDPVSKIRVSNPGNLIDTDFEYGLQPTKWETVEIINNTPAFFSKSGDTTISDITGITTNAGTREITVTTAFPHNLDVGIPIRVAGTKVVTADGSYIINATPTPTTFTYLSRANIQETVSIFDLYSSIITGEFFQGSQVSISDSEGITTDGIGPTSTLTVKTSNKHGFGPKTPFYFLNLNSTVSKEFESQNNTSLSFDPTNSATAQAFDGSNTLLQTPIDLSNSATTSLYENSITSTNPSDSTVTVSIASEDVGNWANLKIGSPLYYSVSVGSGFFQANPRGVIFIKNVDQINTETETATFQVSSLPDHTAIPILANMTGFFQIADQAKTFAGNNVDQDTQIGISIEIGEDFLFDGSNQGFEGNIEDFESSPPSNVGTVVGYTGTTMTLFTAEGILDYYVGAMLKYETDGTAADGLTNGATYFVTSFEPGQSAGLFAVSISEYPGDQASTLSLAGGSGNQTFSKIGIALDKDIVHVRDSNFTEEDMLEYIPPPSGSPFSYVNDEGQKRFFFVKTDFGDGHNYELDDVAGFKPMVISGSDATFIIYEDPYFYRVHQFTTTGSRTATIESLGGSDLANELEYLLVGGGGGGGNTMGGGGGGGAVLEGTKNITSSGPLAISVGAGGSGTPTRNVAGGNGGSSSIEGETAALGGGGGASWNQAARSGGAGGGGGSQGSGGQPGQGTAGQGFAGYPSYSRCGSYQAGGGGGGAGAAATSNRGGNGKSSSINGTTTFYGGGGGGGGNGCRGTGTHGGGNGTSNGSTAQNGTDGLGGGGGAGGYSGDGDGGRGGNGIVIFRHKLSGDEPFEAPATGGTFELVLENNTLYGKHTFTSTGTSTFEVNELPRNGDGVLDYLLVGGGGGGGNTMGGGGGGGAVIEGSTALERGTFDVTVGAGGSGTPNRNVAGGNGGNSSFKDVTALGGGGGASWNAAARSGGAGGGGGSQGSGGQPGQGTAGQGFRGYPSYSRCGSYQAGGGGGGAGAAATSNRGGNGKSSSLSGSAVFYGGGGGGGGQGCRGIGTHGGGNGTSNGSAAQQGVDGLGGGGGAGGYSGDGPGGRGGNGIVILRYVVDSFE